MCGIAGIVKFQDSDMDVVSLIQRMNEAIKHRGPDGEGYLAINNDNEVALYTQETPKEIISSSILHRPVKALREYRDAKAILAHRRLKIIDLMPTGHQPMCNANKDLWIVFNGEIYNYIELKEELKHDYTFHTTSDTEVILAAYAKWGYECVNRFNGMWSFVIYDKRKKVLFASRDRFGVKPFYYTKDNTHFAFASEQKALVGNTVKFNPNEKAIFDYWLFSDMEEEEEGMFKGIYELFPSHSLTLSLETGELKKWRYYTLPYLNNYEEADIDLQNCQNRIRNYVSDAVRLRLRSDVEVASCLSGGIDSSSIVSSIYEMTQKGINTFTTAFKDQSIDESPWAKIVSDYTHSNAHYTYPTSEELVKDLHNLIYCQDIPIWSTSTYAQYRVMQLIKESNIKVVLDGQGGDELFAGYDNYYFYYFRDLVQHGKSFHNEAKATGRFQELKKRYRNQVLYKKYMASLPLSIQLSLHLNAHPEIKYLNKDFLHRNKERIGRSKDGFTLNQALYQDFNNNSLLKSYLKCEDRCSMWHSVESRTPFSDDVNLIEYVFSLPYSIKIKNGTLKALMRDSMRGIVPDVILDRKDKMGYVTPNRRWIAEIRESVKSTFDNSVVSEYMDTKKILKDYDTLFNQPNAMDNGRIFKLMAFPMWLTIFSKK
jgi:asparagine synthase (glutamine-hydrolysing)